ncbi:MAG: alcohol dehydrogenase catalytic domain-containing protein [Acidobacteriaceae bacterium]
MKALVLREYDKPMSLEDRPMRDPMGSEVCLKVKAAGICGTDLKLFRGKNPRLKLPIVLGHEFAGEVVAIGPEVRLRREGDRAVAYMYMNCGQCEQCLSGHENLCSNRRGFFGFDRDGGFAEYVLIPEANLVPIPDTVDFDQACILGDAVATSWHAVRTQADLKPTQFLLVVGLGGLGLHAVQCGRACGGRVIALDSLESKLALAIENGAQYTVNSSSADHVEKVREITNGRGADAVVIFRPHPEVIEPAIKCARPGGSVVMVAYIDIGRSMSLDQRFVQSMEVRLMGARGNTRHELTEVVQLVANHQLDPLIAGQFPLEQATTAFEQLATGQVKGRLVFVP